MKHIHKEQLFIRKSQLLELLFDTSSIFFDIETTGFSPAHSSIYLIGCARRIGESVQIDQFFAETPADEKEVVSSFLDILKDCRTIISYNGIGFDIPFLKAKCDSYKLKEQFKDFNYLDIFKSVSKLKFLLKLPNYKQKTLESFLGLSREDRYSGGDLINVYQEYCKSPDPQKEELLLLHNYEDVLGMMDLLHGDFSGAVFRLGNPDWLLQGDRRHGGKRIFDHAAQRLSGAAPRVVPIPRFLLYQ
jgi:hypothetical protein